MGGGEGKWAEESEWAKETFMLTGNACQSGRTGKVFQQQQQQQQTV